MAWTTPKTWAALSTLTATDLNTHLRDNLNYLKGIVESVPFSGAQASYSGSLNVANNVSTNVTFNSEQFDYGGWFTASNTKVIIPATAIPTGYTSIGIMAVGVSRWSTSNGSGSRYIRLLKNGSTFGGLSMTGITDTQEMSVTDFTTGVAGDYFELQIVQTSGGSLAMTYATLAIIRHGVAS